MTTGHMHRKSTFVLNRPSFSVKQWPGGRGECLYPPLVWRIPGQGSPGWLLNPQGQGGGPGGQARGQEAGAG